MTTAPLSETKPTQPPLLKPSLTPPTTLIVHPLAERQNLLLGVRG